MRTKYDDELLQKINDNVDLLEYVSQDIDMTRRGEDYFGRCPKHIDKTPSFSITPSKNCYYCFSCGRSGRFIGYLMDYEGLSFDEAVQKGAQLASVDMSKICASNTVQFLKRVKKLKSKQIRSYSHKVLESSVLDNYKKEYPQLWLDEGITKEAMDKFGVMVDTWGNRIVYPVYDLAGRLINIKGRTMYQNYQDLDIPKYINYYKVGVMDYFQGLNYTLPDVKKQNEIILFESVKSVMKAWGWGYRNCASAEKHTLTEEQVMLLVKLKVNIVFAWDSDVDYQEKNVRSNIDKLKRVTNVYTINDRHNYLGGFEGKNAPVDLTKEIWEELYSEKRKVI
ncbi:MAG: CHC2 zinc finger domain-containing protein [Prevotella sp.]|nr:CHC2 zinc finger domain-containing protein [Prevotella sp.]